MSYSLGGISALPFFLQPSRRMIMRTRTTAPSSSSSSSSSSFNNNNTGGTLFPQSSHGTTTLTPFTANFSNPATPPPTTTNSSNSNNFSTTNNDDDETSNQTKVPFGYSRKDVILIGLGVTFIGIALKTGLEFAGVDPLQAGNVVQLVLVLGLTVGWISTYIFRVSNKEMTYAQQLRDYESKVMEKRLESLTEAELEVLLQEVEEEKSR